ncbi:patatin-like phospholipase family protein [Rhodococcus indonesiensis]
MLDTVLDIFRVRQYFDVLARGRDVVEGVRTDTGFLVDVARAALQRPLGTLDRELHPFPPFEPFRVRIREGDRIALAATGGSGALASLVGVARALEEGGIRPSVVSVCSGSALFGFPIAAGVPADEVAAFTLALDPADYVDVDWRRLLTVAPTVGRGFAGILRGDALEATYRRLLGDMTLAAMPVPAYAPIWNIEQNRLEYLGPRTYPDLPVARAVHMAVALPLFVAPVELGGFHWCDGGIVDIFPVHPLLDLEQPCEVTLGVNGFYPPGFEGEDATGWAERRASILYIASQVRTSQQVELARENLARLRAASDVTMVEPVPYAKVRGVGFYRQFLGTRDWAEFMRAGRAAARRALAA